METEGAVMEKPHRWTLGEIHAANEAAGYHYFDRGTLRFFGQTMRSFRVWQVGERVFIYSQRHEGWDAPGLVSFAEFDPKTGRTSGVDGKCASDWSPRSVREYLDALRAEYRKARK